MRLPPPFGRGRPPTTVPWPKLCSPRRIAGPHACFHDRPMITNHVLRSIRYILNLSDQRVVEITQLAAPTFALDKADVQAFLRREDDPEYADCSDAVLARFLDGLVVYCRGRDDRLPPRPPESRVTNNVVLKKLRVA